MQNGNQDQIATVPRSNWKENLTCYKCGEKEHLARECPHTGSSVVAQNQQTHAVCANQELLHKDEEQIEGALQRCSYPVWALERLKNHSGSK